MPSNIANENISDIKIGTTSIDSIYQGINQVFPNTRQISSLAFTDTSSLTNSGGTRVLRVGGQTGAAFNLAGSQGASTPGSQVLSSASQDFNVTISANSTCGAGARTPTITVTALGDTALAGGLSNTVTLSQAAGPTFTIYSPTGSTSYSVSKVNYPGTTYAGPGTSISVTHSYNGNGYPGRYDGYIGSSNIVSVASGGSGGNFTNVTWTGSSIGARNLGSNGYSYGYWSPNGWGTYTPSSATTGSGSFSETFTLSAAGQSSISLSSVNLFLYLNGQPSGCQRMYNSSTTSGTVSGTYVTVNF